MALEAKLELKLSQKLIMTPQLQQAIKLLQLSRLELTQLIAQEIVENPVLEETITEETEEETRETEEQREVSGLPEENAADVRGPSFDELKFISNDYFEERGSDGRDLGYFYDGEEETPSYEQLSSRAETLTDHLLWQLRLSTSDKNLQEIGELIIGNLDENGYLQASLEEIASLGVVKLGDVENAHELIQGFDPSGVAARDLRECLLIQIKHLGLQGSIVEEIVKNHLSNIETGQYQSIARGLNIPLNDVFTAIKIIEGLEPKPGRSYNGMDAKYITPDIFVQKIDDEYVISLNDDGMPRLRLSPFYKNLIKKRELLSAGEREYVENKLKSAVWLMKSIEQRSKTIYKVAESIVKFQEEFLGKGLNYLKPMTLKNIAEAVSMHESTISRVTSNKYMQTPQGLFELKYFFSGGLPSGGERVSTVCVRDMVKKMVSMEDHQKPLSDQQIVEIMKGKDIDVARRTIAKYRMELNIPPANIRRRLGQRKEMV